MSREIGIVGCSSNKWRGERRAARKYKGQYFRKRATLAFQEYDDVFILSAKYGLVHHSGVLDDYDVRLGKHKSVERLREELFEQLHRLPETDRAHVLAGRDYVEAVTEPLESAGIEVVPVFQSRDLNGIGYQIGWLTDRMAEIQNDD